MLSRYPTRTARRLVPALLLAVVLIVIPSPAQSPVRSAPAQVATLPVSELSKGMTGIGRTVFAGTTPEDFNVEILGVLTGAGYLGDLILIRVSGPAIERAGGIAAGMSGSPVYIGGKLVGAIAYVFPGSDHFVGMVTPIADMMRVLSYPERVQTVSRLPAGAAAATPVLVSGVFGRAYTRLEASLASLGLKAVPAGGGAPSVSAKVASGPLVPGSSIGVQLARGDIELTAVGTVTYVDGGRFLAFGHPFLGTGQVELFACSAYVHGTIKSDNTPFKMATPGQPVGTVTQDRLNAIAGRFGKDTAAIPATVQVIDSETGREKKVSTLIAPEESLIADIFGAAALAALDGSIERIGPGTATTSLKIDLSGRPSFERSNVFFSRRDVSAASVWESIGIIAVISENASERARIDKVHLTVEVEPARKTALIEQARVVQESVKPGEPVDVEVTLRTYRGARVTKVLRLDVPADVPGGELSLCVRGGGFFLDDEGLKPGAMGFEELIYMDLDDLFEELSARDCNNELVVELEPYLAEEPDIKPQEPQARRDGQAQRSPKEAAPPEHGSEPAAPECPKAKAVTDWVIEGIKWVTVNIEAPEDDYSPV
ncbi:MAG: hypothetical protein NUW23_00855 [Firmicutes bacterium]|nr:hypothetical protein [Bacillota bacterium]